MSREDLFSGVLCLVQLSLRGPSGPTQGLCAKGGRALPTALHLDRPPWLCLLLLAELGHFSTSFPFSVFINSLSWDFPVFCVASDPSVRAIECLNPATNIDLARSKLFFTSPLAFLDVSVAQNKPVFVLKSRVWSELNWS